MKKMLSKVLRREVVRFDFLITKKKKKKRPETSTPCALWNMRESRFQNLIFSLFSGKQRIFSKNIIRTKIFYVKFSTKKVSTKFFSTHNVTKLRSFKCDASENIIVCVLGIVVMKKPPMCQKPNCAGEQKNCPQW